MIAKSTSIEAVTTQSGYKQYAGCISTNPYNTIPGTARKRIWYCAAEGCLVHVRGDIVKRATSPVFCNQHSVGEKRI